MYFGKHYADLWTIQKEKDASTKSLASCKVELEKKETDIKKLTANLLKVQGSMGRSAELQVEALIMELTSNLQSAQKDKANSDELIARREQELDLSQKELKYLNDHARELERLASLSEEGVV